MAYWKDTNLGVAIKHNLHKHFHRIVYDDNGVAIVNPMPMTKHIHWFSGKECLDRFTSVDEDGHLYFQDNVEEVADRHIIMWIEQKKLERLIKLHWWFKYHPWNEQATSYYPTKILRIIKDLYKHTFKIQQHGLSKSISRETQN